jgi:hypothetical protein
MLCLKVPRRKHQIFVSNSLCHQSYLLLGVSFKRYARVVVPEKFSAFSGFSAALSPFFAAMRLTVFHRVFRAVANTLLYHGEVRLEQSCSASSRWRARVEAKERVAKLGAADRLRAPVPPHFNTQFGAVTTAARHSF